MFERFLEIYVNHLLRGSVAPQQWYLLVILALVFTGKAIKYLARLSATVCSVPPSMLPTQLWYFDVLVVLPVVLWT